MKRITFFIFASLFSVMIVSAAPATGLQFAGNQQSILTIAPNAAFSPAQFTIEVWVNYQVLNGGGYILSTEGWSPTNHGFSLRLYGNKLQFAIGDGSNWPGINSSADIVPNTWFHAAVTYTGTQMTLFINGVQDATAAVVTPMVASTESITFGDSPAWPGRNFNGQMADFGFWNVIRTPDQIVADMTSILAGTETGLVAYWKMNEGKGTTAADATGTYNLTVPTTVAWFGTVAGINPVLNNSADIKTVVSGRTLEVSNNSRGNVKLAIYSVNGQKVLEDFVVAGNKLQKQLTSPKGAYILKSIAEDGSTISKKFIITE